MKLESVEWVCDSFESRQDGWKHCTCRDCECHSINNEHGERTGVRDQKWLVEVAEGVIRMEWDFLLFPIPSRSVSVKTPCSWKLARSRACSRKVGGRSWAYVAL